MPFSCGYLKDGTIKKFDAEFFQVPAQVTDMTDPMGRLLVEKVFEAIMDAGQ